MTRTFSNRFRLARSACCLAVALAASSPARAPDPGQPLRTTQPRRLPPPQKKGLSAWESDEDTFFTTVATDMGFIYLRPRVTLGYGSPYWKFVGIDSYFLATNSFVSPYVGWRASFPFLDALMGVRQVYPFDRRLLPKQDTYTGDELAIGEGDTRSTYNAVDFELVLVAPLLHGAAFFTAHPVLVDAPRNMRVFEEVLRVVMEPPMALGLRGGYVYGIGDEQAVKAGVLIEHVVAPGRPKNTWRAGPVVLIGLSKYFDFLFAFSPVLSSPDELGILHGTYAYLGVLHRFSHRF